MMKHDFCITKGQPGKAQDAPNLLCAIATLFSSQIVDLTKEGTLAVTWFLDTKCR